MSYKGLKVAVVDREACRFDKCNHECQRFCPPQISGQKVVEFGEDGYPIISEALCIGCGICEKKCPYEAIRIVNLPSEYGKERVHQYGPNSFRLYRLPTVRKGSVVGLVGMNGIGKSTALKILSGSLIPNLGNYESGATKDEVIRAFKGTSFADYFRELYYEGIKVSIKPQPIYSIPATFHGTVKELIESISGGVADDVEEELHVKPLFEMRVDELSGGELQKVAVAAAASKAADYYFFDEPSSYLDVYARLSAARVIRRLAERAGVLVVEHDLTVLDYVSDYIHIIYGEPAVYGIVSRLMGVGDGINSLIEGEIRQENVRIRQYPIRFREPERVQKEESRVLLSIPSFTKSYTRFRLEATGGEIMEGELVGGLGPNGIGKTTFLKVIAGVEKDDEGKVTLPVKVSYKPQYLQATPGVTVEQALSSLDWNSNENYMMLIAPLRIDKLLNKDLGSLSGGELQKVAVAATLLRDAVIYVFDEPSAFLDVEERLALSRIIGNYVKRTGRAGIIIDHDLMLVDLLTDRIMIFMGEPNSYGRAIGPLSKRDAMNEFLKSVGVTYRRDEQTKRPRVNKPGSRLDREQKAAGEYYYVS